MLLIISLSTFICFSLVLMGIYWLLARPQSAATERLKKLGQKNPAAPSVSLSTDEVRPMTDLAERLASPLSRLVPASAAEAHKLQKQLMHAGLRAPSAPIIFRAIHLDTVTSGRSVG